MKINIKINKWVNLRKICLAGLFLLFFTFNALAPVIESRTELNIGVSAVVYADDGDGNGDGDGAGDGAGAGDDGGSDKKETQPTKTQVNIGEIISFVVSSTAPLVSGISNMVGALLSNDWVYGAIGVDDAEKEANQTKMADVLKTMWMLVRDIVNYVFIIILVVVALMNVLSAGSSMHDKFAIKTTLPKIVIALVAVNFTWFGAKLILDAANVATHIVFAIPQTASEAINATNDKAYCLVEDFEVIENGEVQIPEDEAEGCPQETVNYGKFKITWKEDKDILSKLDGENITKLFAFSFLHIERLPVSVDGDGKIINLTINSIFAFIVLVIVLIIFAVMVFVLFLRIILLWLNIILSPIFVLLPVLQDFNVPTGDDSIIGIKAFLKQAFIPAAMALPMVVGLTMIIAGQSLNIFTANPAELDADKLVKNFNNVNFLQQTMWYILVIAIMWSSVQVAEKSSDIAGTVISTVTAPIKDATKWLAKSPQYIPFLPVKKDVDGDGDDSNDRISLGNLTDYLPLKMEQLRNADRARSRAFAGVGSNPVDDLPGKLRKLMKELEGKGSDVRNALTKAGDKQDVAGFWSSFKDTPLAKAAKEAKSSGVSPEKFARAAAYSAGLGTSVKEVETIAEKFGSSSGEAGSDEAGGGSSAPADLSGVNFDAKLGTDDLGKVKTAIAGASDKNKVVIEIVNKAPADKQDDLITQLKGEINEGVDWDAVAKAIKPTEG